MSCSLQGLPWWGDTTRHFSGWRRVSWLLSTLKIRCLICIMKEVGFIHCALQASSCISASVLVPQSCLPLSYFSFSLSRITQTAASLALVPGCLLEVWQTNRLKDRTVFDFCRKQNRALVLHLTKPQFLIVTAAKSMHQWKMSNSLKQFWIIAIIYWGSIEEMDVDSPASSILENRALKL